ncbi:MAG: hypothetical protein GXP49_00605 [Deltaproteobacteria bacterium]|nr:hypothetical protein [Deltaproteobacteria bacterium]
MNKAPLALVNEKFGNKKTLVDKVATLLQRPSSETREQFKARLSRLPNLKLLRLYNAETMAKEKFGGRSKLVDAVYTLARSSGKVDKPYKNKLATYTTPRLLDLHRRLSKRTKK